jgi:hypothetical protein
VYAGDNFLCFFIENIFFIYLSDISSTFIKMKFLAILVLLSALGIAACAAYFSIIGLKLLFVGGGISIVVMGTALEIGKIVTVTFLHQMWHKISTALKSYLIIATFLLIVITSIGIYGYLSAGYNATSIKVQEYERQINFNLQKISSIEAENVDLSTSIYNVDEIEQLNKNREAFIQQRLNLIAQREEQIKSLRNNSSGSTNASTDLVAAKSALDLAKSSLDSEVERELQQINIYNNRLEILDSEVQTWLNQGRGNIFRQNGIEKAREVRREQEPEREQIENQIKNAQRRIDVLREQYANQVREYNERVASIEQRTLNQNQTLENNIQDIQTEINLTKYGFTRNRFNTGLTFHFGKITIQPAFLLESLNKEGYWTHTQVIWINSKIIF